MAVIERIGLTLALSGAVLATILSFLRLFRRGSAVSPPSQHDSRTSRPWWYRERYPIAAAGFSMVALTMVLISRIIQTGHGPFSNMYEFAASFTWGILAAGFIFFWKYKNGTILPVIYFIALLMLVFARVQYRVPDPLVPALQQSLMLSVHVASAVVAYGMLAVGFGASVLYLACGRSISPRQQDPALLE